MNQTVFIEETICGETQHTHMDMQVETSGGHGLIQTLFLEDEFGNEREIKIHLDRENLETLKAELDL